MSDHPPRTIERHCDVAIIGGSAAGLAAALQLTRLRRSVIVIDAGEPRNAPAHRMHGYLGHDGVTPGDFASIARDDVRRYGTEVLAGRVTGTSRTDDERFRLALTGGHAVVARRVLVATGIVDVLPDVEGLAEHWGRGIIHCPFCHGYEVRDQPLVQIVTHPAHLHPAALFAQLSDRLTIVLHDVVGPDHPEVEVLRAAGVRIVDVRARRVVTADGRVVAVEVDDGEHIDADSVIVGTRFRPRIDAVDGLEIATTDHPSGLGHVIETDPTGATSVVGVYAAGNVTDPGQQVLHAAASGSRVGAMIGLDLAHDDLVDQRGDAATVHQTDWDHRYSGSPIWSGNPNGSLVAELTGLAPDAASGTALDVGAGEGGDAVWLAERGWTVTANDVSQRAVDRIDAIAAERGLPITGSRADANDLDPYGGERFDLVAAHYASIPRTHDDRGIANLLAAVAPGGTLLVVGHDLEPMRRPIDTSEHSRAFDPDAFVRVDDVAAVVTSSNDWHVDTHETRPRPAGHAAASHHVDDVVLRARRVAP